MSFLSRPKQVASAFARGIDRAAAAVGRLGVGAFGWPVLIGMGLGAGLFGIWQPRFLAGVLRRRATMEWMRPVLESVGVATVTVVVVALAIAIARRRRAGVSLLDGYTHVLRSGAFLSALPLVVALREPLMPDRQWLVLGFIVTTAVLSAYSTYHFRFGARASTDSPLVRRIALGVVCLAAAAFAWTILRIGIANHLAFNTSRGDLGIYVSLFRESSEGRLLACTLCYSGPRVYAHLEPIILLLAPAFLVHPFAETLIVLQALIVASGAIPLYLLARRGAGAGVSAALALAYLSYAPLQEVALFDFHSVALALPLLPWLFYSLERGAMRTYWALAFTILLVREDMCFVLACVGAYALTATEPTQPRTGWMTLALAFVGLLVMHFAAPGGVTSTFREVATELIVGRGRGVRAAVAGELPSAFVQRVFTEAKALHAAEMLAPVLGLPLLARGRVVLLYGAILAVLATKVLPSSPNAHQLALLIPFLFVLTAKALGRVRSGESTFGELSGDRLGRALTVGVLVSSLLGGYALGGITGASWFRAGPRSVQRAPLKEQLEQDRKLRKLSVSWPKGVKVAASSVVLPHLGPVSRLYTLDDRTGTDYVVASMKQRATARRMEAEESSGQLSKVASFGDISVYRPRYRARLPKQTRHLDDD